MNGAHTTFRMSLKHLWLEQEVDGGEVEHTKYRQWCCWLVRSAHYINGVLKSANIQDWRLRVPEFAKLNARILTEEWSHLGVDNSDHGFILILPVWTDEPDALPDEETSHANRNEHLWIRLQGKPYLCWLTWTIPWIWHTFGKLILSTRIHIFTMRFSINLSV